MEAGNLRWAAPKATKVLESVLLHSQSVGRLGFTKPLFLLVRPSINRQVQLLVLIKDQILTLADGSPLPAIASDTIATLELPEEAILDKVWLQRFLAAPSLAVDNSPQTPHLSDHGNPSSSSGNALEQIVARLARLDAREDCPDGSSGGGQYSDSQGFGSRRSRTRGHLVEEARSRAASFGEGWQRTLQYRESGNEHDTYKDPSRPGWRIKATLPDLVLQTGRPRWGMTELTYLTSWHLANQVFGDNVEFIGVIESSRGLVLINAQPELEAADAERPHPSKAEICEWLRKAGFNYQSGAWVRDFDGVVLSDEHEGNFIATAEGIRPIDLHLRQLPGQHGPLITWDQNPVNPHRRRLCPPLD